MSIFLESCVGYLLLLLLSYILYIIVAKTFDAQLSYLRLIDWVRLNVPPTHYRSYGDGFLRVKWPNQQCQSTEGTVVFKITCYFVPEQEIVSWERCGMGKGGIRGPPKNLVGWAITQLVVYLIFLACKIIILQLIVY